MNLNEYQSKAIPLAIYPKKHTIIYPTLGLVGEAGEVAEKIKKWLRGDLYKPSGKDTFTEGEQKAIFNVFKEDVAKELGDVLWYLANLANDINYSLSEIAQMNLDKLTSRKERGTLKGSGDDR